MDEGNQSKKQSHALEPAEEQEPASAGAVVPSRAVKEPFIAGPEGRIDLPGLPESFLPGIPMTRLEDKYEFLSVLGAGGAGVIYKARQQPLGRMVAVKMIHSHLMSPTAVKRFHQEAKTISRLSHPNIITVFDFGISEERQPFMVMDYVEGTPLSDLIKEHETLPLSLTNEMAKQVCDGMMHAHAQGILHRDLKPSNVMLVTLAGGQHLVKILDFGLAKILVDDEADLEHLTLSGETVGTPEYMSPEQAMGKSLDQRSDIYSLGCVMYHCLTGTPPFVGETNMETMLKQLNNAAAPMNAPNEEPRVPPYVEAMIMCLLDKSPDNRVQTMLELKDLIKDLESKAQGEARVELQGEARLPAASGDAARAGGNHGTEQLSQPGGSDISDRSSTSDSKITGIESAKTGALGSKTPIVLIASISVLVLAAFILFLTTALHDPDTASRTTSGTSSDTKSGTASDSVSSTNSDPESKELDDFGDQRLRAKIDNDFNLSHLKGDRFVTDAGLNRIAQLPYIQSLNLDRSKITNEGIKKLEGAKFSSLSIVGTKVDGEAGSSFTKMPNLKVLDATETALDDNGVAWIVAVPQLTQLNLDSTNITDACSAHMAKAKSLEFLSLRNTRIGDTTASAIAKLAKLNKLNLANTAVGDAGARAISKLSRLSNLNLDSTKITDRAITYIAKMPALLELNLSNTRLTDGSVDALCKLEGLQRLYLMNCKLTRNAITRFQRKNASCILVMTPTEED